MFLVRAADLPGYLRASGPAVPLAAQVTELGRKSAPLRPPRSFNFTAAPVPLPGRWVSHAGPRPRVLAFVAAADTASLVALGHQFDFDLTLPFLPRGNPDTEPDPRYFFELGDRYDTLFQSDLITAWTAALDPSIAYDVIVLGGAGREWAMLPHSLQANILARVQNGTGLVVIRRGDVPAPLHGLLPLSFRDGSDYHSVGPLLPADDRTVRGLPWTILPGFEIGRAHV